MNAWAAPMGAGVSVVGVVGLGILAVQEHDFGYASGAGAWLICAMFFIRQGLAEARAEDAKRA